MSHISDKSGVKLDITDAYTINIGYILEADSGQVPLNRDIICGKVDGRWYVVDPDQLAHGINFATEYANDEVGRNDFSTITTLLKYDKVESKLGDVPEGMSNDPLDGNLSLNGSVHVIPFRVGDVAGGWKLDKHNLKEENKKLSPGEYAYSNSFRNMECRDFKGVTMTTLNMTDEEIAFEDSTVVGFDISLLYGDCDKEYPEVVLPKGITIGSSVTDIYNAYGEAENIYKGKLANWASVDYKFTETKDGVYRSYSYDIDVDFEHGVKDIHVFYFEF